LLTLTPDSTVALPCKTYTYLTIILMVVEYHIVIISIPLGSMFANQLIPGDVVYTRSDVICISVDAQF